MFLTPVARNIMSRVVLCKDREMRSLFLCIMKKLTQEDFVKYVDDKYGDEYTVLGKYTKAIAPVRMRHNKCSHPSGYFEYDMTPHSIKSGKKCPYESHQYQYTLDMFIEALKKIHPDYICVGTQYKNATTPIDVQCDKGHVFGLSLNNLTARQYGCPYCSGHRVWQGFNDLNTTHPELTQYLKNREDGTKIAYGSHSKIDVKCPFCGLVANRIPATILNTHGQFLCQGCADGYSYPEKFVGNVLRQLDIDYVFQLTSAKTKWVQNYQYDYYIPEQNAVIEVHGEQHYIYESQMETDKCKRELANNNNVQYVEIDARNSTKEWIKKSLLQSILSDWYDLSKVDWEECNWFAGNSLMRSTIEKYNNGILPLDIAKEFKILPETVYSYLQRGADSGKCIFNKADIIQKQRKIQGQRNCMHNCMPVKCVETGVVYASKKEAKIKCKAHLTKYNVDNPNSISAGYHWITI